MAVYVIYLPGLNERYDGVRQWALAGWKLWGVRSRFIASDWYGSGTLEDKLARIQADIEQIPQGNQVVLIGESAGAVLALHAAAMQPRVSRVITICGVARTSTPIARRLRERAPALDAGVTTIPDDVEVPVHSVRAIVDHVVRRKYTVAKGASEHVVWTFGHITTIIACLTILSPFIASLAKRSVR